MKTLNRSWWRDVSLPIIKPAKLTREEFVAKYLPKYAREYRLPIGIRLNARGRPMMATKGTYTAQVTKRENIIAEHYAAYAYWASYLINGDASGLEDGEQDQIDEWFANEKGIGGCVGCSDESEFKYRNDATNLGGDVLWYRFPIIAATGC